VLGSLRSARARNRDGRDLCESEPDGLDFVPFLPLPSPESDYPSGSQEETATGDELIRLQSFVWYQHYQTMILAGCQYGQRCLIRTSVQWWRAMNEYCLFKKLMIKLLWNRFERKGRSRRLVVARVLTWKFRAQAKAQTWRTRNNAFEWHIWREQFCWKGFG
jgi:hypothetical protein